MQNIHYRLPFRVRTYEADHLGRATLQSICNYLQEAASVHADSLGFGYHDMSKQRVTWILVRLAVEMQRYPGWQEEVIVETWPSEVNNVYAFRDFKILDGKETEIGRATTQWAIWHMDQEKVIRPSEINLPVEIHSDRQFFPRFKKLESLDSADRELTFRVRKSDLDLNVHVNNVKYIEWALEAILLEDVRGMQPEYFDIIFRNQTFYGETVRSAVKKMEPDSFRHLITKNETEVIRAVSIWKNLE